MNASTKYRRPDKIQRCGRVLWGAFFRLAFELLNGSSSTFGELFSMTVL